MAVMIERSAGDTTIRPFTIEFPEADLEDLRARIAATRFPEKETVEDDSQGVPLALMQDLARYWASEYDWRKCEARLNALPNFLTEIDGLDIHFIHVRSKHEDALPMVVCHGWPGSIVEQLKLIGRLTDPTAHGASASDAFHVVIPSMPGYGFSGKPTTTGWDPVRIGKAYVELMKRLGYERFVAQGGDWGAIVVDAMAGGRADPAAAEPAPPELVGIHTNMAGVIPPELFGAAFVGTPAPSGLSDEELSTYEQMLAFFGTHVAYGLIMGTRPQTLYGLADSPIDLAAFMLDHGDGAGQPGIVQQVLEERLERPSDLSRDDILDNITLFWLTNTGVSSARLYWENKLPFFSVKGVKVPVGVSTFADEIYRAPRSWAEQAYPNLVSYNQHDRGGHFAAWEQPELLSEDVRETFRIASLAMTLFERVHMPSFAGATEWLNCEPLGPAELPSSPFSDARRQRVRSRPGVARRLNSRRGARHPGVGRVAVLRAAAGVAELELDVEDSLLDGQGAGLEPLVMDDQARLVAKAADRVVHLTARVGRRAGHLVGAAGGREREQEDEQSPARALRPPPARGSGDAAGGRRATSR